MINSCYSRKRSLNVFRLSIRSHRTWYLLRIIRSHRNMTCRSNTTTTSYHYSISRVCTSLRTNIILSSNRNYEPMLRHPLLRNRYRNMTMGRIFRKQRHVSTILCISFLIPNNHCSSIINSPAILTRKRVLKPIRSKIRMRRNQIPPLLLRKRPSRVLRNMITTRNNRPIWTKPTNRPRKLY